MNKNCFFFFCWTAAKVEDFCLNDQQCRLNNQYTHCKWIIPRIYGKCKCPLGNKLTKDDKCLPSNANFNLQIIRSIKANIFLSNSFNSDLGNRCYSDSDCQAATNNSICRSKDSTSYKESICICKEDYEMSDDKLHCKPVVKTTGIA